MQNNAKMQRQSAEAGLTLTALQRGKLTLPLAGRAERQEWYGACRRHGRGISWIPTNPSGADAMPRGARSFLSEYRTKLDLSEVQGHTRGIHYR